MTTVIPVGGPSPYDVVVGPALAERLPAMLPTADTVVLVVDRAVVSHAEPVRAALDGAGRRTELLVIDAGERAKDLTGAATLWDELGRLRVTRSDALVAVGGGATTDLGGFVAATWLRGIRVVHVPTTLLGMVDAAVGGKTGINTAAGKNLVGAFHPPAGVLVDLDVLDTLPPEQWVNGMAEVVKAGFIADPAILELVDDDPGGARAGNGKHRDELVERSIRMKAAVVSEDLREAGRRESLNYGHTLGHAIERHGDYRMPHGHAIAIGMCFAAALARLTGHLDAAAVDEHRRILELVGLPTRYAAEAWPELLELMRVDKKARGATLRFVVLDGIGRTTIEAGPDDQVLAAAYSEVAT